MKKFLRMLNDFLNCREYEQRISNKNKEIYAELEYVQDLLLAETAGPEESHLTSKELLAKVDVYVAYLKIQRQNRKNWRDALSSKI